MKAKLTAALFLLSAVTLVYAATLSEEIDDLLGKSRIISISNAYFALYQNLYPEQATRIGLDVPNNKINDRTEAVDARRKQGLEKIRKDLNELNYKKLSIPNKTDYEIVKRTLASDLRDIQRKRFRTSARYYTQAIDSIYDLMLKRPSYRATQVNDITSRLVSLPAMYKEAREQLKSVHASDLESAKEEIYNAFVNTKDIEDFSRAAVGPEEMKTIGLIIADNKAAMREFFDYLGKFKDGKKDFSLGNGEYNFLLKNKYFIDKNTGDLISETQQGFLAARKNLLETMAAAAKAKNKNFDARALKASDFYEIKKSYELFPRYQDLFEVMAETIKSANSFSKGFLPEADMRVNINHMPGFIKVKNPSRLFVPPYGMEMRTTGNLFINLDLSNRRNVDAQMKRFYSYSQIKVIAAKEVVPGKQMFYTYSNDTVPVRRAFTDDAMVDGWALYAGELAKETRFLDKPEDFMFLAWERFTAAAKAYADLKFHRRDLDREEVKTLLMSFGLNQQDAEEIIQDIIRNPGKNIAAYAAFEEINRLRQKFANELGSRFSLANFHLRLFTVGKVPVSMLEDEMKVKYTKDYYTVASEIRLADY